MKSGDRVRIQTTHNRHLIGGRATGTILVTLLHSDIADVVVDGKWRVYYADGGVCCTIDPGNKMFVRKDHIDKMNILDLIADDA